MSSDVTGSTITLLLRNKSSRRPKFACVVVSLISPDSLSLTFRRPSLAPLQVTGDYNSAYIARACGKRDDILLYCNCIGCLCCYIMAQGHALIARYVIEMVSAAGVTLWLLCMGVGRVHVDERLLSSSFQFQSQASVCSLWCNSKGHTQGSCTGRKW
eukprot:5024360-Pleurochrysis_carterae.AAC.2